MYRAIYTILLLLASNTFMTIAWYGHLKFKEISFLKNVGLWGSIFISWGIALIEYLLMVPANKVGAEMNGGPFNMWQLKMVQEIVSILVFIVFTLVFFKSDTLRWNHFIGFLFLIGAIYFFFRK